LGLPTRRAASPAWTAVGIAIVIIMAAIIGYAAKFGRISNSSQPEVINTPIRPPKTDLVPVVMPNAPVVKPTIPVADSKIVNSPVPPTQAYPKADEELKSMVAEKAKWGPRLVSLKQDAVSKVTTVVFSWPEGEDEHDIATDLAKTILEITPDPETIILRGTRKDKLIYQVEVPRDKYDETQTDDWQQKNTTPDAWVAYVLTNELYGKAVTDALNAAPPVDPPAAAAEEKLPAKDGGAEKG
jgi:hypothetical protein